MIPINTESNDALFKMYVKYKFLINNKYKT